MDAVLHVGCNECGVQVEVISSYNNSIEGENK
jgi:hypothetical protein